MGQDGIPMSIAILFSLVILGAISLIGIIITAILSA